MYELKRESFYLHWKYKNAHYKRKSEKYIKISTQNKKNLWKIKREKDVLLFIVDVAYLIALIQIDNRNVLYLSTKIFIKTNYS